MGSGVAAVGQQGHEASGSCVLSQPPTTVPRLRQSGATSNPTTSSLTRQGNAGNGGIALGIDAVKLPPPFR